VARKIEHDGQPGGRLRWGQARERHRTDIQSPGIHVLFGLAGDDVEASLNDFLWHGRPIREVAQDVSTACGESVTGSVHLIPSSMKPGEIARILREGYDAQRLTEGLRSLVDELRLDVLLIDTHPGLNEETLLSLVISDALIIVMRPDKQDYEDRDRGTRGMSSRCRVSNRRQQDAEVSPPLSRLASRLLTDVRWPPSPTG
jgi:cellulose biosynthesis protein BcsQ